MLKPGMFIADRYEILEKIGSGGMSDVYKAKCHKLNRYVAIKVLKPEFSEDRSFVTKFRVEAQSAAGLIHANIVNVYDVGDENGIYYIVMELVEGITLKKYIEKKGRLGVREAVSIAIQVAQGIEAAHNHHIVHRDIKPQNIIISKEGKVKVTDFGIARAATSNTINSNAMGSVHYISPEQARGGYSDEKSDIYSFGIMLYEMLTGRVPFEGDTTVSVALQHIQDDIVSPAKLVPGIPISVEKIVLKCTQKKTERRYQNMSDLIADLKRSLVAPDEDFVVMRPVASNGPTKMITEDELDMIHQMSSIKSTNITSQNKRDDYGYDEEEDDDYEDTEDDDRTDGGTTVDKVITALGITVAVIIVIITLFIIFKMVSVLSGSGNNSNNTTTTQSTSTDDGKTEVPRVTGYSYEEAQTMLNNVNLGAKLMYSNSSYDAGTVIEQNVAAGTRVTEHTTIILTVSNGPESFSMINVEDMTEDGAREALAALGLKVSTEYVASSEVEQFHVISSTPKHLAKVKQGDEVTLYVSMGDGKVYTEVPLLAGMTEDEAKNAIVSNGFEVGTIKRESSQTVAPGVVIAQSGPTAGEKAAEGSAINFVVSSGSDSSVKYVYLSKTVLTEDLTSANLVPQDATFIRLNFVLVQNGNEKNIASQEFTSYAGMAEKSIQVRETLSDFNKGSAELRVFAYYVAPSSEQTVQLCSLAVTLTE